MVGEDENPSTASLRERAAQTAEAVGRRMTSGRVTPLLTAIIILGTICLHYLVATMGFPLKSNAVYLLYFATAVLVAVIVWLHEDSKNIVLLFQNFGKYLLVYGIGGIVIPGFVNWTFNRGYMNNVISDFSIFFLAALPVAVIYLVFFDEAMDIDDLPWLKYVLSFYFTGMTLFIFILLISGIVIPGAEDFSTVNTREAIGNSWDRAMDRLENFGGNLKDAFNQTQQRLDPYHYIGQVEDNKDRPLGITLVELQPIDPIFYYPTVPIISGIIEAETFLDRPIAVRPTCTIDRERGGINYAQGAPNPESVEVFGGFGELFECRFNEDFEKGVYPVEVEATFDFETWADVTYDFVREDTVRSFAQLRRDIYQELDIDKIPQAVYTGGPVSLGMSGASSRLPIVVTTEEPYLKNAHLGFTIESRWPQGELNKVDTIELLIPEQFTLFSCDRKDYPDDRVLDGEGREVPNAPGYESYIFENIVDAGIPFTSIRCGLGLKEPNGIAELASLDKASRTFILKANYTYTITGRTEFQVGE